MKIVRTPEILAFIQRCYQHMHHDYKNDFLGMTVTKENENKRKRELKAAGFAEFADPAKAPSLFLSLEEWQKTPYHANVRLDTVKDRHFHYRKVKLRGQELFNSDVIQKDPQRELNDWMKLRAMDRDFEAIYLYQDNKEWMLDAPGEANTNNPFAMKAQGRVLTFGLGIGYFVYMCSLNEKVRELTVIERSPEVIAMFRRYLLPQFPSGPALTLIEGDAFTYFNKTYLAAFDYVYTDIWQNNRDGLAIIEKLLMQYNPPLEKADFWIEDSCEELMWSLIFRYFACLVTQKRYVVEERNAHYAKKVRKYFAQRNEVLSRVEELQFYMYDRQTIREILAGR